MQKVRVIGLGYVGKAVVNYFKDHYEVYGQDVKEAKLYKDGDESYLPIGDIPECDLAVVCVPTPSDEAGQCDTSIVEEVIKNIPEKLILIKSTVRPGTTLRLGVENPNKQIVFSPEYIGEGKYSIPWWKGYPHPTDMKYNDFHIFGGNKEATHKVMQFFKRVSGPDCKYLQTNSNTAEMVKYFTNTWGATKVVLCNEFALIADKFGVDYDELRELLLNDKRLERMHTAVFEDKRGYGGKCYPKDVKAIVEAAKAAGYTPDLLEQVIKSNDKLQNYGQEN